MIVVCGEALIDLVPLPSGAGYAARPGGSPANVAVGLGRLGVPVALLSRLAADPFGRLLAAHVESAHVDTGSVIASDEPSTLAVVTLDDEGKAEYAFYVEGAADGGWRTEDLPASLPEGAAVHVSGSLALAVPSMGETLEALLLRERGSRLLALDPNVRPRLARDEAALRARLDRWVGLVDVLKVSEDDLDWISPGVTAAAAAERWLARGPKLVVVTRGGDGVHAHGPAGPLDLPGLPVDVVDTVGAGDAFMAGLLADLHDAGLLTVDGVAALGAAELERALAFAQQVAAETCRRAGADPPWRTELAGT